MTSRNQQISTLWKTFEFDANGQPVNVGNAYLPPPTGNLLGAVKAGNNITIAPDGTINATGGGGGGGSGVAVPFVSFVSSSTPSAGQAFVNSDLSLYNSVSSDATVVVNGAVLTPIESFSINGSTLTILDNLAANSVISVQARTIVSTNPPPSGALTSRPRTSSDDILPNDLFIAKESPIVTAPLGLLTVQANELLILNGVTNIFSSVPAGTYRQFGAIDNNGLGLWMRVS